jgi:hypothetical protein
MARENPRIQRNERGDHVGLRGAHNSFAPVPLHELHRPLRPFTPTWCELAMTAVAVMCVAPALVVGLLLLLEAALPNANGCASANVATECPVEAAATTRTP